MGDVTPGAKFIIHASTLIGIPGTGNQKPGDAADAMEMKRLSGGNLRAAGYDDKNRVLVVELTSGTFQYSGVTADMWQRFAGASSPWSFFRDNIEEEFPAKRIR
jgi:KTSC domain